MQRPPSELSLNADGLPENNSITTVVIKDAKTNVSVYVPASIFNFFWRLINLLDPATDSTKMAVGLTQTTVTIAIPLSIGSSLIHVLIKALQHDDVQRLFAEGNNREATSQVLAQLIKSAKNPDSYFKALYDFATCVGWSAGYIAFTQIAEAYAENFWAKLGINAAGAACGNVAGALAVGMIWGAGSLVYDYYCRRPASLDRENDQRPTLSRRTFNYLKETLLTIPPSMVWSMVADSKLFQLLRLPSVAFRYAADSWILATAVNQITWLQNILVSRFCPTPLAASTIASERSALLRDPESARRYDSFSQQLEPLLLEVEQAVRAEQIEQIPIDIIGLSQEDRVTTRVPADPREPGFAYSDHSIFSDPASERSAAAAAASPDEQLGTTHDEEGTQPINPPRSPKPSQKAANSPSKG